MAISHLNSKKNLMDDKLRRSINRDIENTSFKFKGSINPQPALPFDCMESRYRVRTNAVTFGGCEDASNGHKAQWLESYTVVKNERVFLMEGTLCVRNPSYEYDPGTGSRISLLRLKV